MLDEYGVLGGKVLKYPDCNSFFDQINFLEKWEVGYNYFIKKNVITVKRSLLLLKIISSNWWQFVILSNQIFYFDEFYLHFRNMCLLFILNRRKNVCSNKVVKMH